MTRTIVLVAGWVLVGVSITSTVALLVCRILAEVNAVPTPTPPPLNPHDTAMLRALAEHGDKAPEVVAFFEQAERQFHREVSP
jgi:hypothetical protein